MVEQERDGAHGLFTDRRILDPTVTDCRDVVRLALVQRARVVGSLQRRAFVIRETPTCEGPSAPFRIAFLEARGEVHHRARQRFCRLCDRPASNSSRKDGNANHGGLGEVHNRGTRCQAEIPDKGRRRGPRAPCGPLRVHGPVVSLLHLVDDCARAGWIVVLLGFIARRFDMACQVHAVTQPDQLVRAVEHPVAECLDRVLVEAGHALPVNARLADRERRQGFQITLVDRVENLRISPRLAQCFLNIGQEVWIHVPAHIVFGLHNAAFDRQPCVPHLCGNPLLCPRRRRALKVNQLALGVACGHEELAETHQREVRPLQSLGLVGQAHLADTCVAAEIEQAHILVELLACFLPARRQLVALDPVIDKLLQFLLIARFEA